LQLRGRASTAAVNTKHEIRTRPTPWKTIILLCGKCASRLDGGYGPKKDDTLRSALRRALKDAGHRRDVRIIGTRCMGICPKKAVIAINASRPATIFVVPVGTPAEDVLHIFAEPAE
jgi:predicted metal-binding protein